MINKNFKVCCILDEFSYLSFGKECDLYNISLTSWKEDITNQWPDFIFIESAWFGFCGQWRNKVSKVSIELVELLSFCRENKIPTAFWNKEDPVHFDRFIETASLFDAVFTTSIESIPAYKYRLGHQNIYLLPFSAQPVSYNPLLLNPVRKNGVFFAGAYYRKYSIRCFDFDFIFDACESLGDRTIYDRYANSSDLNYRFPEKYQKYIEGFVDPERMGDIYKNYNFGINLNSVMKSSSMFSRRALEMIASGVIVVSNKSDGLSLLFGDLILSSANLSKFEQCLMRLTKDVLLRSKLALAGVRKIMLEHSCASRFSRVTSKLLGKPSLFSLPSILVLLTPSTIEEARRNFISLSIQAFDTWHAVCIVGPELFKNLSSFFLDPRIRIQLDTELNSLSIDCLADNSSWVCVLNPSDHYGPNYLLDLILATRYSGASSFGKKQYFEVVAGEVFLQGSVGAYRPMTKMELRSSLISIGKLSNLPIAQLLANDDTPSIEIYDGMSLDYLSYCRNVFNQNVVSVEVVSAVVDDLEINQGSSIDELYVKADGLKMAIPFWLGKPGWKPEKLAQIFGDRFTRDITGSIDRFGWHIISEMRDGDTYDLFSEFSIPADDLGGKAGTPFYMEAGVGLQMQLLMRFEEASGALIDEVVYEVNIQNQLIPPDSCTHIRLGYRITSSGSSRITRLVLA